jgi:hypothetical protein
MATAIDLILRLLLAATTIIGITHNSSTTPLALHTVLAVAIQSSSLASNRQRRRQLLLTTTMTMFVKTTIINIQ